MEKKEVVINIQKIFDIDCSDPIQTLIRCDDFVGMKDGESIIFTEELSENFQNILKEFTQNN